MRLLSVVALALAIAAAGCATAEPAGEGASPSGSTAPATPAPTSPSAAVPTSGASPTTVPPPPQEESMSSELQEVVDAAIADLEARPVTGTEAVRVVVAREETFPNGAIGCPKPGEMYTQALVDGYRVLLARGDRVWLYTAGENGIPQLCASDDKDGGTEFVPPPGFDE